MPEQLDIFGDSQEWETATPKAQEKAGKPLEKKAKQEEVDNLVIGWMRRLDYPVSCDEMIDRMKPIGLPAGSVAASMKRLRKHERIKIQGPPDPNCEQHQAIHNNRWVPAGDNIK